MKKEVSDFMSNKKDSEQKEYFSLAPNYNAEYLENYEDIIIKVLDEPLYKDEDKKNVNNRKKIIKRKNKNIAISAIYGAGKSSIIRSFFLRYKQKYKALYVTLGSYLKRKTDIKEIEISILQQIIYTKRPNELPLSNIYRSDEDKKSFKTKNIEYTVFLLITILFIYIITNIKKIIIDNNYGFLFFLGGLIGIFAYIIVSFINMHFKVENMKFNIPKSNIGIKNKSTSILNNNIEELINFFINTEYDTIVFEDIDRLQNNEIFNKLKEINDILNNSIGNKTIRFIYAICDDIFDNNELRTKFFDVIIPIVPYIETGTNEKKISNFLKSYRLDDDDIKELSYYLKDARHIYDFVNEFNIYYRKSMNDNNKRRLLYLTVYKVLYPKGYSLLLKNKGSLAYFYSKSFEEKFKTKKLEEVNQELETINNIKSKYEKFSINLKKQVLKLLDNDLNKKYNFSFSEPYVSADNHKISSLSEFLSDSNSVIENTLETIRTKKIEIKYGLNHDLTIDEENIFSIISKQDFLELIIFSEYKENHMEIAERINELNDVKNLFNYNKVDSQDKIDYLETLKYGDIPSDYIPEQTKTEENIILSEFEKDLIKKYDISDNYKRLINTKHEDSLDDNLENIIDNIKSGKQIDSIKLDDAPIIFKNLTRYDFTNDSVCDSSLFEILLSKKNRKDYLNYFFDNVNTKKIRFLIKLQNNNIDIMKNISKYYNIIWNRADELINNNSNQISQLVYYTIRYCTDEQINNNKNFIYAMSSMNKTMNYLEKHYNEISDRLDNYKIIIDKEVELNIKNNNINSFIYENRLYQKCSNHIIPLCNKYEFNKEKIIESIYKLPDNNKIKNYLLNDINDTIENYILKENLNQNDDEESLKKLIKIENISKTNIEKLFAIEKNSFTDITEFNDEVKDIIIRLNRYTINWKNLHFLFDNNIITNEEIIELINTNINSLSIQKDYHQEYHKLTYFIIKSPIITSENLSKIIRIITKDIEPNYNIDDIPYGNRDILIKNDFLIIKNQQQLNQLSESNYSDLIKTQIISRSFDYIYELNFDKFNIKILNKLFSIKKNSSKLLHLALNHMDMITVDKIYNYSINNNIDIEITDFSQLLRILKNVEYEIKVFIKYKKIINENNIYEIAYSTPTFQKIIINKEHFILDNKRINIQFLNYLKQCNVMINYYKENDGIIIN